MNLDCQAKYKLSPPCGSQPGPLAQQRPAPDVSTVISAWRRCVAMLMAKLWPVGPAGALLRERDQHAAWAHALNHIGHLDAHQLRDIGAPPWVVHEIKRKRTDEGRQLRSLIGR